MLPIFVSLFPNLILRLPSWAPSLFPTPQKTDPGLSSRISSHDQPENSFLPLIRNSRLLSMLSLASVSPWYVPQDNPWFVSLLPLQWAFPDVHNTFIIHNTASLITNSHSSKFSSGIKRGQGEGKVPFLRLARGERGSHSSARQWALEPLRLKGWGLARGTRRGGSRERGGISWNKNFTH